MSYDRLNFKLDNRERQYLLGEIESVRRWLENKHYVTLPEIDVILSDSIAKAMSLFPPALQDDLSPTAEQVLREDLDHRLELRGLAIAERCRIGLSKFTIFLPSDHLTCPLQRCEDIWHEMAHAAEHAIGLRDEQYAESFAVTYSFIGLLQGAKLGKFSLNEVFDQIELVIKRVHLSFPLLPHRWSLKFVEKHVSHLEFRGRNPDELLACLNTTIDEIVDTDREVYRIMQDRKLTAFERPRIILLIAVTAVLMIVSLILSLLHRI